MYLFHVIGFDFNALYRKERGLDNKQLVKCDLEMAEIGVLELLPFDLELPCHPVAH